VIFGTSLNYYKELEESFTDQLLRERIRSAYTSSPIDQSNESQDFQDSDDVSDLTNTWCDSAFDSLPLTKSNLDRRGQLTWIEEKAEWGDHEEQNTELRIQLQQLKNELEGLVKDKSQLIEQLNAAEEGLAKEAGGVTPKGGVIQRITPNLYTASVMSNVKKIKMFYRLTPKTG
jgi:hypothetical protein